MVRNILVAGVLGLALAGCQKAGDESEKLDQIAKRLDSIEQKLDKVAVGGAAPGAARPRQARPQPDLNKVYSVPVEGSPFDGPEHAKVTIVKAHEYACPYCERVRSTLDALREKYGDDVKIVYKQLIVHPDAATTPALAVCAAFKQGKFSEMDKLIWEKGFKAGRNLSQENMEKLAAEVGLDMQRFKADMQGQECKAMLQKDRNEVTRVGASGTPAFFINGRFLSGARPQNFFEQLIDEELKKANDALDKGGSVATYYEENVVKKGAKSL